MLDEVFKERKGRSGIYIAEIGLNHNGDMDAAGKMIDLAYEAGADAVKFQTIVPGRLNSVYTRALLETGAESFADSSSIDFFTRFRLNSEQYRELKVRAGKHGMVFFSSPFDDESVDLLEELQVPLYKIASSEVTNIPLIRRVARTGKPLIMSTGIAFRDDISLALESFRRISDAEVVLLHCVSNYPVKPDNANVGRVSSLAGEFGVCTGFSDHSRDSRAMVLAAALGARIFEKHFTIDRNFDCPDKDVSVTPDEFRTMIDDVEQAIAMTGSGRLDYGSSEGEVARAARRSLFAGNFIAAGSILKAGDIIALRPGVGIPVSHMDDIIGLRVKTDIKKDHLLRMDYFEQRSES